jgi:thioredoxin-like negative regulator of GroEL
MLFGKSEDLRKSARTCFDAARMADPNDMESLMGLASLAFNDRVESQRLLESLQRAGARYPESEYVAFALAQSLWAVGQQREALEHLRAAIESTRDLDTRREMTETYRKLGGVAR